MKKILLLLLIVTNTSRAEMADIHSYDRSAVWAHSIEQEIESVIQSLRTFIMPVNGKITSQFGMRKHPILGVVKHHSGVDIGCAYGTPIRAVLPGRVAAAGSGGGLGSFVTLSHTFTVNQSRYGHLSKIVVNIGQEVRRGDIIAYSGNSGLSTGPHLHFELLQKGKQVDPQIFLSKLADHNHDTLPSSEFLRDRF